MIRPTQFLDFRGRLGGGCSGGMAGILEHPYNYQGVDEPVLAVSIAGETWIALTITY